MILARGTATPVRSRRAQSSLIGMVLLIGMVATASFGIFLVGGEAVRSAEQQSENERVEQAFVELSQRMSDVSVSGDTSAALNFDIGEHGAIARENTGSIEIREAGSGDLLIDDISFGTIEYTDDGSTLAYEAGAVFRENGPETQIVSAPAFDYDEDTYTLNFPIVDIASGEQNLRTGDISFENTQIDSKSRVEENQRIQIEVTSEYWKGWETYFIKETGASWAVTTEDHPDPGVRTVTVNLGQISHPSEFSQAVRAGGDIHWSGRGAGVVEGPVMAAGNVDPSGNYEGGYQEGVEPLESIDDEIEDRISEAEDEYDAFDPSSTVENGTYYADGDVYLSNDFDLSNGNVTLVVDGMIHVDRDVVVRNHGGEHSLYIYSSGGLDMNNNEFYPDGDGKNPEHLQVYGSSSFEFTIRGNGYFEGVVYAPSSSGGNMIETASGNPEVYGSLVGGSVALNGNPTITHDASLMELEPNLESRLQAPPDLIYLNLAHYAIDIRNN